MSQKTINSFFTTKKKNAAPLGHKRKADPGRIDVLSVPKPDPDPEPPSEPEVPSKGDSAPPTPTKFRTPSKDLDLAVESASRAKRARLGDLNARLEKALQAQEERKKTAKKVTQAAKPRPLPVPFPDEEEPTSSPVKVTPPSPQLSRKSLVVDVVKPREPLLAPSSPLKRLPSSPTKPAPTRAKASPRRWAASEEYIRAAERASESGLRLPYKYKFLLEVFRNVDQIVSMKFNRRERIKVEDIKPAVQTAMKRNFADRYLTMIRAVFPQSYRYAWEQLRSKYGQKKDDYELHLTPNLGYRDDLEAGVRTSDPMFHEDAGKAGQKMGAKDLIARRQIFAGILYTMVHDQHREFLKRQDPPLSLPDSAITAWHADFDLESCHDVAMTALPSKPDVARFHTAADALSASRNLFGVNRRLEEVLKKADEAKKEEAPAKEEEPVSPSKMKGLEGLPPAVVKRILAKQKAKQIKAMTEKPEEKKEKEMLEEMQTFGPLILNCLMSEKQRQSRAAVALHPFLKFVGESHGRTKSAAETESAVRTMLKLAPEWLQVVSVRRVEYLKDRPGAPDSNALRRRLKELLEEKSKV